MTSNVCTITLLIALLSAGCVSIKLGDGQTRRAEGVRFEPPRNGFKQFEAPHVDAAWKNSATGTSISFLSECSPQTDPPLEAITKGILQDFTRHELLSQEELMYNGRAALRSVATGPVDGIPSKVDILVFKKNGCTYVLSMVALEDKFAKDLEQFEKFLQGFKAP